MSVLRGSAFSVEGLFVYRLGRKILILERGVRFPYGLPEQKKNGCDRVLRIESGNGLTDADIAEVLRKMGYEAERLD